MQIIDGAEENENVVKNNKNNNKIEEEKKNWERLSDVGAISSYVVLSVE